ncbi:magnesium-dependent phosphatase-1 [Cladochytrium replicatum]|nr:magnesium-dependent phosphatase-1 [Cladochytrium replicatum]
MVDLSTVPPEHLPKCFVFDLDYTCWDIWIDSHVSGPPFKFNGRQVVDYRGSPVPLYPHVPDIFKEIKKAGAHIAIASRTHTPDWARAAMKVMPIDIENGKVIRTMDTYIDHAEMYPSDKQVHLRAISTALNVPLTTCVFFDDEHRNIRSVSKIGVTCIKVHEGTGANWEAMAQGLRQYSERAKSQNVMKEWLNGGTEENHNKLDD